MTQLDITLSTGEASTPIAGSQLLQSRKSNSMATLQILPSGLADAFTVTLEGRVVGVDRWSNIGTFTNTEDERIFVFDISTGAEYRVAVTTGTNVRMVVSG